MKPLFRTMIFALLGPLAWAPSYATDIQNDIPDIEKIRFCKRIRDHAIQTLYNRDRGAPMKLYEEDGNNGPRIVNVIIRRIYEEPQISTPQKAAAFGQATCNEMMGVQGDS